VGTVTDVICNGDCNGTITLNITGGTAPYNVSWDNGDVGQSIQGLCIGTYVATVTDAGGCVQTASFTVNEPAVLIPNISVTNQIACSGDCNGEIESNPIGGVAPYSYAWNTGGATNSLTGLCAGTYTVTVTDDAGCQQVDSITLTEPTPLVPTITVVTQISCNGTCDGELEAFVTGGVGPYTFAWSNGQPGASISGLCDGTYVVTITDANGCDTMLTETLIEPSDIVTTPTVTDANCGICDGIISLNTSGGTGTHSYNWLNVVPSPGNVSTVTNLCAGSYTIVTTDGNGCTDTISVPVNSIGGATGATFTEVIPSCNGVCDGSLTVTPIGGIAPYTYLWSTGPSDTNPTVNNLCGGSYTVTITDANGCDFIASEQLIFPFGPFTTFDTANANCSGNCDGSITITNTMGTGPFTYLWDDGSSNIVRTGLCAGAYTVTTTDGNGCTHIDTIDITEPLALSATITTTDASCNNTCDGTATVVVSNGTAPYSYLWSNGELNDNPVALCVCLNTVTITDANGCTLIEDVTIGGPTAIVFDNVVVDSSGCGASDGTIEVLVSGGAGGYSYAWSNSGNTNPLTGLSAGTYTVTVTDANGCTNSLAIPLSDLSGLPLLVSSQDASCNGVCDGEAYASSLSVIGIPSFTWSTVPVTVDDTAIGLCAGQYFVTLEDLQSGCITVDSVTIGEPPVLQFASFNTVDPNCGATDGEINPVVVGGTAPYTYTINSAISSIPFTGLGAGSYTIEVTDANGCTESSIVDLQDVGNITLITTITDASCGNTCDGMVTVTPPGVISNYTFAWSNSTTNDTLMNACAGSYTVTVTDINTGCTGIETVTVGSPPAIAIDFINVVNPSCGFADGSIEASASGGAGNFTYDWGGGLNTALISNLPVGTYTVTVTDASGCTEEASIPLSNVGAPVISTSATPASCDSSCTGTATVTVPSTGGPYTIQWSTNPGDTDPVVSNVCPGLVSVTVTDPSGCIAVDTTFISVPDGIEATLVAIDNTPCQGNCTGSISANVTTGTPPFTYAWSIPGETGASVNGLCAGTYTVTISSSDACEAVLSTTIIDNPPLDVQVTNVDFATCATSTDGAINISVTGGESPYTYNWESNGFTSNLPNLANILPGEYRLTVSDVSGCQILDTIQVDTLINLEVSVDDTVVCGSNVSVTLEADVSTNATTVSYQWFDGGNPLGTDSTQSVTIFNAGDTMFFSVQVVGDGCTAIDTARVISVAPPSAEAGPDTSIVRGETVMIGGSPTTDDEFATVQWTPGGSLDDSSAENPMASPDKTTVFIVEVTNSEGCISTDQMTMTVDTRFEYPDGFSPNGDGTNDTWELDFLANYLDSKVTVFNRWGTIVYESDEGYPEPWDGTMDGEDLPIGTYYYIIDLGDEGVSEPLTGPITIMR
jgi:gliding motility-associated-like protein